jgi:hypothetical protein
MNMSIDELTHADHAMQLGALSGELKTREIDTQLIDPNDELPVTTLLVALDADDRDRERTMAISIMPLGADDLESMQLAQFYVQIPFKIADDMVPVIERATSMVNAALAIGHFGVQGNQLFLRHVLALPRDQSFDPDMTVELIGLLAFHQEHFGDYFEALLDGELTLSILPQAIAQG